MSRFSPLGPGIGQAIRFDDRDRLARVLIRPIPAPNSCVLGVGPRNQRAIRHMLMPSLRLQAGFLTEESVRFPSILICTFIDQMRDLGRKAQLSWPRNRIVVLTFWPWIAGHKSNQNTITGKSIRLSPPNDRPERE